MGHFYPMYIRTKQENKLKWSVTYNNNNEHVFELNCLYTALTHIYIQFSFGRNPSNKTADTNPIYEKRFDADRKPGHFQNNARLSSGGIILLD